MTELSNFRFLQSSMADLIAKGRIMTGVIALNEKKKWLLSHVSAMCLFPDSCVSGVR